MILQNCAAPDEVCGSQEIYYRSPSGIRTDREGVILEAGQELASDTYMNTLDLGAWKKYTTVDKIYFLCELEGRGVITLIHQEGNEKKRIKEVSYGRDPESEAIQIELPEGLGGRIYFELKAETKTVLKRAGYVSDSQPDNRISLSLVICTYRRREHVEKNLEKLRRSSFFQTMTQKNSFVVRVVDNAKELSGIYGEHVKIYANENTGGSGGFTRGMEESVKEKDPYQTSHVILMDDDVELQTESLSRLYALLSYMKPEYRTEPVAGRMFRLDRREVQYTAAEIWNGGEIRHIGFNLDMTQPENLVSMNDNGGAEYGGWWFACYPMGFVEKNKPLPFFLHCDDVEYGLRHGGTPIVLNGIQVWHETYEYRQLPVIAYYDTRNALIVNALYCDDWEKSRVLKFWKDELDRSHDCETMEFICARLLGILHYCSNAKNFMEKSPMNMKLCVKRIKKCNNAKIIIVAGKIIFKIWNKKFYSIVRQYRRSYKKFLYSK